MLLKAGFVMLALWAIAAPANAEVYCRAVGIPKGCVARPDAGAPGVGVAPGVGAGAPCCVVQHQSFIDVGVERAVEFKPEHFIFQPHHHGVLGL